MHISELKFETSLHNGPGCCILLPGSSGGLHHPLMKMLYKGLISRGKSTAMLEYPYQTKNAAPPANDLSEELDALKILLADLNSKGFERFIYIGKSLGGLVATWLMREDTYRESCDAIHIMGCVLARNNEEGVDMTAARDKIGVVIQGELDDYGNSQVVTSVLTQSGCNATVIGITDGDHSYRHMGDRDLPTHEQEAVDKLFAEIF